MPWMPMQQHQAITWTSVDIISTSKALWHSSEGIVISTSEDTNLKENMIKKVTRSPGDQWVK